MVETVKDDAALGSDPSKNQNPDGTTNPGATTGTAPGDNNTSTSDPLSKPGRRLKNPLANYPNYTYQITLYMITPDAYDKFALSGRTNIGGGGNNPDNGVFIVAQSGGISGNRATGFELDYYIDDLRIKTTTSGKDTQASTNTTEITFKIVEPYGFSFLSNLNRAQRELQAKSQRVGYKNLTNAARQFYVLGIRFLGFNLDGSPITGKEKLNGMEELPGASEGQGIFERFYDIVFTELKFKLDGKTVVYNIKASSLPANAVMGSLKGLINNGAQVKGETVYDCLQGPNGLLEYLNQYQQQLKTQGKIKVANVYNIKWQGNSRTKLGDAKLVSQAALDKWRWSNSNARTTAESNDATGTAAPSKEIKPFTFNTETPIIQAIETIVKNSQFLERALQVAYEAARPPTKNGEAVQNKDTNVNVSWYHISAAFSEIEWDDLINQFSGKITYVIEIYDTPIINNAYSNPGVPYYGPHKRYEYWYTGKNSEIINYEQQLNNGYFTIALGLVGKEGASAAGGGAAQIPIAPEMKSGQSTEGRLDRGLEAHNAYITNLYDPVSYAEAKVTIMGDPDFLIPESTTTINSLYNQFYGTDGFTISANGGQVFIEINFKEAEDYNYKREKNDPSSPALAIKNTGDGLLNVNESIQFWKYPKKIREIQEKNKSPGVSYQVLSVHSTFNSGKFTQLLNCVLNTFPDITDREEAEDTQKVNETPGPNPNNSTSTATSTGMPTEPQPSSSATTQGSSTVNVANNVSTTAAAGSNDDAAGGIVSPPPTQSSRIQFDGTNWYDENGNIIPTDATGRPITG